MGKRQGEEEEHDKQWSQNIHIQTNICTYTQLMSWMKVYFVWLVHDIVSFIFTLTKWRLYYFRSVHTVHIIHEITDVNFKPINPMRLINLYLTCLRLWENGDQSCTTYNTVEQHTSCKKKPKKKKKHLRCSVQHHMYYRYKIQIFDQLYTVTDTFVKLHNYCLYVWPIFVATQFCKYIQNNSN